MKRAGRLTKRQVIETPFEVSKILPGLTDGRDITALQDERAGVRQIEMVPLKSLKPASRNARRHSRKQIEQICNSMVRFGVINPIIIDSQNRIVAGHARAKACRALGRENVPVIRVTYLSDLELRALMLADNKLAENAGWDRELLALEFEALQIALPAINLDLGITGFDPGEIDSIMTDFAEKSEPGDEIPELAEIPVAKPGDFFILGHHRLIVGDACNQHVYAKLMGSDVAEMAFLDPPYNVKINGHVGGRGRTKHREFAQASGEMTSSQFIRFLEASLGTAARFVKDGGIFYCCMDWRHASELLEAGASVFDELKNICVWTKSNAGQGGFYRSQHEFIFVYKRGKAAHINTFQLGRNGRNRSNVWSYAGVNSFRAGRMDELKMHPTVKPVAMIADAMRDCSRRDSIVLDSFCGSGSTIMAAEQVGRRAYCVEIDPLYADVAIRRWQRATRQDAILKATGQTFDELSHTTQSRSKPNRG